MFEFLCEDCENIFELDMEDMEPSYPRCPECLGWNVISVSDSDFEEID